MHVLVTCRPWNCCLRLCVEIVVLMERDCAVLKRVRLGVAPAPSRSELAFDSGQLAVNVKAVERRIREVLANTIDFRSCSFIAAQHERACRPIAVWFRTFV